MLASISQEPPEEPPRIFYKLNRKRFLDNLLILKVFHWCRNQESNPGPTDYKSVALPAELFRHEPERPRIVVNLSAISNFQDNNYVVYELHHC